MRASFDAMWPPNRVVLADEARRFVLGALDIKSPNDADSMGMVIAGTFGVDMKTDDIAEVAVDLVDLGSIRFARDGSDNYERFPSSD